MAEEMKKQDEKMKEVKTEEKATNEGKTEKKIEMKEEKKENNVKKGKGKTEIVKKDVAIVKGNDVRISTKMSIGVCKMIRGKSPKKAVELLEGVVRGRIPVRLPSSEVAHQKSRGMKNVAGGKFPKKAAEEFIRLIKQLEANAIVNGVENPIITLAKANKAARPYKSDGRKAKRTHVQIEVRSKTQKLKETKEKK